MFSADTSGDITADRRFALAMQLYERGDALAALDLLAQAEELVPAWPPLPFRRGEILMALGQAPQALEAFNAYLKLDPADHMGAGIKMTLLGGVAQPDTLPPSYVAALFDDYAPRFEAALLDKLEYRAPDLIAALVEKHRPCTEDTAEAILDLGCGTGLMGGRVAARAMLLEGVDLSAGMIEIAQDKGIYSRLVQDDLAPFLRSAEAPLYDLILAADVLVYIGALEELFAAAAARLAPGGSFVFSTQALEGPRPFLLGADHRYAHSAAYVDACLAAAGLKAAERQNHVLRKDGGNAILGHIVLAERP